MYSCISRRDSFLLGWMIWLEDPHVRYTKNLAHSFISGRKTFQQGYFGITNEVSIVDFLQVSRRPSFARETDTSLLSGNEYIQLKEFGPKVLSSICNITLELRKSPNDDYREIHDMDLPFKISLLLDISQSMTTVKGRARFDYYLRAIITKKPNFKHPGSTKIMECAYTVNRYILPHCQTLKVGSRIFKQ